MTYLQKNLGDAGLVILTLIMGLILCLLISLASCKTRYITTEIPVVVHDKDSIVSVQHFHTHDTLMMRDSVLTFINGDTIRIERWHTLQSVNNVIRVDTLWREKVVEKPVQITKTEIQEVNRLKWWQKALMWLGGIFSVISGWKIYRLVKK